MVTDMAWLGALAIAGLLAEGAYLYFASSSQLWVGIGSDLLDKIDELRTELAARSAG